MAEFTFFELHVDDAQFSAAAPFSGRGRSETTGDDDASLQDALEREGDSAGSGQSAVPVLVGLLAVAAVVAAVRALRARRRSG